MLTLLQLFRWILVSHCRATQGVLSGSCIIGIHPGEPKHATIAVGTFPECTLVAGMQGCSGLWNLNKSTVEGLSYLLILAYSLSTGKIYY